MLRWVATISAHFLLVCIASVTVQAAERFHAVGPSSPEKTPPHQQGVVNPVELKIDERAIKPGKDFRIGYEATAAGTSLILWLRPESKEPVKISLRKGGN